VRRTKNAAARNAALIVVIAGVAVAVGSRYSKQTPQSPAAGPVTEASPAPGFADPPMPILPSTPAQQAGDSGAKVDSAKLFTLTVATNDRGSYLEKKELPSGSAGTLSNTDEAVRALNAMADEGENSPLPKGTKALSVTFENDLATVDFNEAFQKNFAGGDENEALALNAVYGTLGQFPGVKQVQILVDGQKIDSLGGNQPLTDPQPVPNNLTLAQSEP
jgi:spore germination protein GerM